MSFEVKIRLVPIGPICSLSFFYALVTCFDFDNSLRNLNL